MLAGTLSAGENPFMFGLERLILFAGAASYVYGVDRYLLAARRLRGSASRLVSGNLT